MSDSETQRHHEETNEPIAVAPNDDVRQNSGSSIPGFGLSPSVVADVFGITNPETRKWLKFIIATLLSLAAFAVFIIEFYGNCKSQ